MTFGQVLPAIKNRITHSMGRRCSGHGSLAALLAAARQLMALAALSACILALQPVSGVSAQTPCSVTNSGTVSTALHVYLNFGTGVCNDMESVQARLRLSIRILAGGVAFGLLEYQKQDALYLPIKDHEITKFAGAAVPTSDRNLVVPAPTPDATFPSTETSTISLYFDYQGSAYKIVVNGFRRDPNPSPSLRSGWSYENIVICGGNFGCSDDDTTPPGVKVTAILRENPTEETTNADSLQFRVSFSEPMDISTIQAADFVVTGGSTAAISVDQRDPLLLTVSGGDLAEFTGTVGIGLAPGQDIVTDQDSNPLSGTEPLSHSNQTYSLDNEAPSVTISADKTKINRTETLEITFKANEPDTTFHPILHPDQVKVTGGTLGPFTYIDPITFTAIFTPLFGAANPGAKATITVEAGAFEEFHQVLFWEALGAVKKHVLEEVRHAELVVFFLHRAGVDDEAKFCPVLRFFILADVVSQPIFKPAMLNSRVKGDGGCIRGGHARFGSCRHGIVGIRLRSAAGR